MPPEAATSPRSCLLRQKRSPASEAPQGPRRGSPGGEADSGAAERPPRGRTERGTAHADLSGTTPKRERSEQAWSARTAPLRAGGPRSQRHTKWKMWIQRQPDQAKCFATKEHHLARACRIHIFHRVASGGVVLSLKLRWATILRPISLYYQSCSQTEGVSYI